MSGITTYSRSKNLILLFLFFESLLLLSAFILIFVAIFLKNQGIGHLDDFTLTRLVWTNFFSSTAIALGVMILLSSIIGAIGFVRGRANKDDGKGLIIFNGTLIASTIVTIITGSIIWFYTLAEREDYATLWLAAPPPVQIFLQDTLSCCGYWNATKIGFLSQETGFCANISNATAITSCITPVTAFADTFLDQIFSTIYSFTIIEVFLFLTTCCLIIHRKEEERFRKIDEKRFGFV